MTPRKLQQVHPPSDGLETPDSSQVREQIDVWNPDSAYQVLVSEPNHWEGRDRLNDVKTVPFVAHRVGQQVHIWIGGESYIFSAATSSQHARGSRETYTDEIMCSIPGLVIAVHVVEDDVVESGQVLVVIESMKTEHVIKSPRSGTVQRVSVQPGDRVDRGMRLLVLHPLPAE